MPNTLGLELCDAGFITASCAQGEPALLGIPDRTGATDWPGFVYHEGADYTFGRAAEDMWFVHPRRVAHTFWSKLAHEPSALTVAGKPPSFSELAFFFLREFAQRLAATAGPCEKLVLAVPGAYLKDTATEDEKIGLLLGMADELKLPLAGIVDLGCAALCDPRSPGFNVALPIVVVDVQQEGTDFSLFAVDEQLERQHFLHLPNSGYVPLFKHLTAAMGNRFLRHTAFDILEDGRIEQTFFRQTKNFFLGGAAEHRYQINTATRNYEMLAKQDQLAGDAQAFINTLVQALHSFLDHAAQTPALCTVALTARTSALPGIDARLKAAGFGRQLRLHPGAAACGAARIGFNRLQVPADISEVSVAISVPLSDTRRLAAAACETRLHKARHAGAPPLPTHAIVDGIGHDLAGHGAFTIGGAGSGAHLVLPDSFSHSADASVALVRENGRVWFVEPPGPGTGGAASRIPLGAGDRLALRCGTAAAEILFAHCPSPGSSR
ncbi:MAG: hypothetical protein HZA93_14715 [Verrucomicrobia bacterium]|nr:hypothetical protein [Verrucomicrobiota bacterium]